MRREIRAQLSPSEDGKVKGYAALFDSWSLPISERGKVFRERIQRGALKSEANVSLWWMHDSKSPLANTRSGTLSISEDSKGIAFEADLGDSPRAAEIRDLVKRGVVSEMSIGFTVEADAWDGATSRTVTKARLHELSLVENAAYPGTFAEVRKEKPMGLKENRAKAAELRAEYQNATDERQLEILEQINEVEEAIASERAALEAKLTAPPSLKAATSTRAATTRKIDSQREWFRSGWRSERVMGINIASGTANLSTAGTEPVLDTTFVKALDQESVIRQLASVEVRGTDMDIPIISNRLTAALVAEGAAYGSADFTASRVQFTSYKSGIYTDVTEEALQDTVWDLGTQVVQEHARAHSRLWEGYFATGTGSSQPRGIFHSGAGYTGVNYTAGSAPTVAKMVDLYYSLNPAYLPNACWLMNQAVWGSIVKDSTNSKYTLNGENGNILRDGAVALFLGKPVYLSEFAPTAYTAATRSVAFGDFKRGYKIIDRSTINFTVDDLSQRINGNIRYSSRMRCDAKPVDTTAIKVLISA